MVGMTTPIPARDIVRVRSLIDPVFLDSPAFSHGALDAALGCTCTLKVETLNPIRSFKGRGTEAVMASLDPRPAHVVSTSSGNFGQGLARAATRRRVTVTIFSGEDDNPVKLDAMRRLGAEVRLVPRGGDGKDVARQAATEMGARFIEDGACPEIAMGAGTLAQELTTQREALDDMLVQIGDGALVIGVGSWLRAAWPATRIIGVTAAGSPSMRMSIEAKRPIGQVPRTIADGIAIHTPVASAIHEVSTVIDEILTVDDDAIREAMAMLLRLAGVVAEPAGAAGIATILRHRERFAGRRVGVIITGSNVRADLLSDAAAAARDVVIP
jgi:threonine dehydratase